MPVTPNIVKPHITGPDKVWFDPRAGQQDPTCELGPQEGKDAPQEITLKFTQSLGIIPADQEYPAGGTLRRTKDTIELYRNSNLSEDTKLDFSENQARLTNAELKGGLKLYAKGLAKGTVQLTLTLDLLETATRKKTDFTDNLQPVETMINVDNTALGAKLDILIVEAEVITPAILPERPDIQVTESGAPLPLTFKTSTKANPSAYDGEGTVTVDPKDSKCKFYKDAKCERGDEVNLSNGYKISAEDLKNSAKTLYAKSSDETASGKVTVQLALSNNTDPEKVATSGPAKLDLTLLPTSKVTPTIKTTIAASHNGVIWYPTLARGDVPKVAFGITRSNSDIPFKGEGLLTRSDDKVALFYDPELTKPLTFAENKAALSAKQLNDAQAFYIQGRGTGETKLTLTLVNDCQPAIQVQEPVSSTLTVKQVTEVISHVEWESSLIRCVPDGDVAQGSPVPVYITQKSSGGGNFTGTAILKRSNKNLAVYKSNSQPLFSGSNLSVTLSNETIRDTSNRYTVLWLSEDAPQEPISLVLTPTESPDPYIITDPSSELAPENEVSQPEIVVEKINTVKPVIETDYDLVLQPKGFRNGNEKNATSPTLAHFYLTQSDSEIGYDGDGTLERDNANLCIFRDKDCTDEIPFVANMATLTNAELKDNAKLYYLQGATAGKCTLTLSLAKPPSDMGTKPNFTVADPATKAMAVIAVTLSIYRDNGAASVIDAVQMTDRSKWQTGRFLPLQANALFGRAKLVIGKVATDTWPESASKHEIQLSISGDKAAIWTAAKDGNKIDTPMALKKTDLGNDKTVWLQSDGDLPSTSARDIHLSLGMTRSDPDKSDFKDVKPARNGDWAKATVVEIARTTPDIENWRQYTNMPINFAVTANTNQDEAKDGQHMLVTATTDPAVKGIGIDFMLWADPGNVTDIPASTKSMDLTKHETAATNGDGKASARLKIGRYGGSKFTAVSFLADDAATGSATFGTDATKAPDSYKSKPVTAWRKVKYKAVAMNRHGTVKYGGSYADTFNQGNLHTAFAESFLELETAPIMTVVNNTPALYLGTSRTPKYDKWVQDQVDANTLGPYEDRSFNLAFVENIAVGMVTTTQWFSKLQVSPVRKIFSTPLGGRLFDTASRDRFMVPGSAKLSKRDGNFLTNWEETIPNGQVKLIDTPGGHYTLEIDLNGVNTHSEVSYENLWIKIQLIDLKTICGLSMGAKPAVLTACRYAEQLCSWANDEVYATTAHEVGHFLGLAPEWLPTQAGNGNKWWYRGLTEFGAPKTYYFDTLDLTTPKNVNIKVGQGNHCMKGFADFNDLRTDYGNRAKVECLMFDSTVQPPIIDICDTCKQSAKGREYALSNTRGNSGY